MDFVEDTKILMQSLTSSDPMQHSVYNHTLLSPHQVSISKAMSLHQCSGLVGGSPSAGSRVIDSLPEDNTMLWGKDGMINHKMPFSKEGSYLTEALSKSTAKIHSTCTFTSQTNGDINGTAQENGCKLDDDDDDDDDDDSAADDDNDSSDDGDDDSDVENFIRMHLARKKESTRRNKGDQAVVSKTAPKTNVNVQTMEGFLQKTDELIKHNLLLQQQISALKRETSLQTKVLTKLLVKRSKKYKKPYDENSSSL